ncbi:multidrug efflux SMR transporter [Sandarakinorhabdus sp.]|uniref:DMT family transporter n=1 Tax=Sandarakinorhabdus sp. TaxID=1916663 RepID=UPI00286E51EC|nr:multidrug efflux SMR transporter [Sandarakinorhabdus sp.]
MAWLALLLGGMCEAGFTTALRHIDGGRNLVALAAFLVAVSLSMGLLALAGRAIPMGTAYAVWAGIGAAATAVIGLYFYGEPISPARLLLLGGLIACIVGLKMTA